MRKKELERISDIEVEGKRVEVHLSAMHVLHVLLTLGSLKGSQDI